MSDEAKAESQNEDTASDEHGHDDHGHTHVMPLWMLGGVLGILLFLTVITVAASRVPLGELDIPVAIGIAVVKSAFVCLFFMHLLYDRLLNTAIFLGALMFMLLFICFAMMDTFQYAPDIEAWKQLHDAAKSAAP